MKKTIILYLLTLLAGAAGIYCLLGVVMASWLSATPDYPVSSAKYSLIEWSLGAVLCFGIAAVCGLYIYKFRRNRK